MESRSEHGDIDHDADISPGKRRGEQLIDDDSSTKKRIRDGDIENKLLSCNIKDEKKDAVNGSENLETEYSDFIGLPVDQPVPMKEVLLEANALQGNYQNLDQQLKMTKNSEVANIQRTELSDDKVFKKPIVESQHKNCDTLIDSENISEKNHELKSLSDFSQSKPIPITNKIDSLDSLGTSNQLSGSGGIKYGSMSFSDRTDSIDNMQASMHSIGSFGFTDCDSLESSMVGMETSLEDASTHLHNEDREKIESDVSSSVEEAKAKKKKRKHKRRRSKSDQEDGDIKQCMIRPNYFVGVQISNSEIHKSIIQIQEDMVAFEPALLRALVDVATSHITLLIARIDDENELSLASSALEEYTELMKKTFTEPIQLTFDGLDNFSNNVLYARVVEDEHHENLIQVADGLRKFFLSKGVTLPNMKPLNPHLTIAKMSKTPRGKGKLGPRKIEPASYANHKDLSLGCQLIHSLQLCAMNLPKDDKRYYQVLKESFFADSSKGTDDHSQCCFPRRLMPSMPSRSFLANAPDDDNQHTGGIIASSFGAVTVLTAALLVVYAMGKISGKF